MPQITHDRFMGTGGAKVISELKRRRRKRKKIHRPHGQAPTYQPGDKKPGVPY